MNKGWLLKSFNFKYVDDPYYDIRNTMYFYYNGKKVFDEIDQGANNPTPLSQSFSSSLTFRYANFWNGASIADPFDLSNSGPSFASSSIIQNKYTDEYYSGSFGFLTDNPQGATTALQYRSSGIGSAAIDAYKNVSKNNIILNL